MGSVTNERWFDGLGPAAAEQEKVARAVLGFVLGDDDALDEWPQLRDGAQGALKRRRRVANDEREAGDAEKADPRQLPLVA